MDINRKQFLGSLLSGVAIGSTHAFATEKLVKSEPTEFEKCRNDILYFVDNYLIVKVDNLWHGKNYQLILSDQQRVGRLEYQLQTMCSHIGKASSLDQTIMFG